MELFAPLSGDVMFRSVGDQLGFININTTASGNRELERRITTQAASYGRQLGRISDALDVVIRHTDLSAADADDAKAINEFIDMREEIEKVKAEMAAENIDRLVAQVTQLAKDPVGNREALDRIRASLDQA
jgi:hypothetical protein